MSGKSMDNPVSRELVQLFDRVKVLKTSIPQTILQLATEQAAILEKMLSVNEFLMSKTGDMATTSGLPAVSSLRAGEQSKDNPTDVKGTIMTASFQNLPNVLLERIFGLSSSQPGDYFHLVCLTKVCRSFRTLLHPNHDLWKVPGYEREFNPTKGNDERIASNATMTPPTTWRQVARRLALLEKIQLASNEGINVFMKELGSEGLQDLILYLVRRNRISFSWGDTYRYLFQGRLLFTKDSILAMTELLQANFIDHLRRVSFIQSLVESQYNFPLQSWSVQKGGVLFGIPDDFDFPILSWNGSMQDSQDGARFHRIIRRLGYLAGIAELGDSSTYEAIWKNLCGSIWEVVGSIIHVYRPCRPVRDQYPITLPTDIIRIEQSMVERQFKDNGYKVYTAYLDNLLDSDSDSSSMNCDDKDDEMNPNDSDSSSMNCDDEDDEIDSIVSDEGYYSFYSESESSCSESS